MTISIFTRIWERLKISSPFKGRFFLLSTICVLWTVICVWSDSSIITTLTFASSSLLRVLPSSFTTRNTWYDFSRLSDYCRNEGSLHQIALQMAHLSSPPGSPSYNKARHILQSSRYFHVYLPQPGLFTNTANNMATAMKGFGLKPWKAAGKRIGENSDFILIEIVFFANTLGKSYDCNHNTNNDPESTSRNCSQIPRIILQTEQLEEVGPAYLEYFQDCHAAPNCMIWDFSDHHYRWAQKHNYSDSVVLLPIMHQAPPTVAFPELRAVAPPLQERPYDVVFFGALRPRRVELYNQLLQQQLQRNWTIRFEYALDYKYIYESYYNAKICLIVHSYHPDSGGEYHRLNELATASDCVKVMETMADNVGLQAYQECGGVVFASYSQLITTMDQILEDIQNITRGPTSMAHDQELARIWWNYKIQWGRLLKDIFQ